LLCFIIEQKYKIETSLQANHINTFKHFYAQNSMIAPCSVLNIGITLKIILDPFKKVQVIAVAQRHLKLAIK